jgi:membrane protease YdiL (CAAX protease family)
MAGRNRLRSLLVDSACAHVLRFEAPLAPAYGAEVGRRMLVAFAAVGLGLFCVLRFALDRAGSRGAPGASVFVAALLAAFGATQRWFVRAPLADVGLRSFADWTRRERVYFLQVVPLASVAFAFLFREHLRALVHEHGVLGFALFSVLTGLAWGITQELLYRGWLQTELTRRLGAWPGLWIANLVFTFGPLHFEHLFARGGPRWGVLAAVFGIGWFFGLVYTRSGNLWIPAVLHGLWPLNMT